MLTDLIAQLKYHQFKKVNQMVPSKLLSAFILSANLLMVGCAETHMTMYIADPTRTDLVAKVWPSPPDEPRYRYVGELTGEANFRPDNWANRSSVTKLLDWLTGLTDVNSKPIVLQRPQSGAVDAEGRVYVTDISRGAVYVFDKLAGKLEVWEMARVNSRFKIPIGIALGEQGDIFVADAELHTIFRLDNKGDPIGEFGEDLLKRPTGLVRDANRKIIYVSDTYSHDIKAFSDDGKLLKIIGQRGEGDGEFNFPTHLAFAENKLFVTDTLNSRVQVFDADGKLVKKFGELGLNVGNLVRPKGLAVDSDSNIYVIESLYDQLLVFNKQGETLLGIGGTGKEIGQFYLPSGVWIDHQNYIYVADMFNGRIVVFQYLGGAQ
jgi:DNA-binding beta-propeller fold protein YncE